MLNAKRMDLYCISYDSKLPVICISTIQNGILSICGLWSVKLLPWLLHNVQVIDIFIQIGMCKTHWSLALLTYFDIPVIEVDEVSVSSCITNVSYQSLLSSVEPIIFNFLFNALDLYLMSPACQVFSLFSSLALPSNWISFMFKHSIFFFSIFS